MKRKKKASATPVQDSPAKRRRLVEEVVQTLKFQHTCEITPSHKAGLQRSRTSTAQADNVQANRTKDNQSDNGSATRVVLEAADTDDWYGEQGLARDILREIQDSDQVSEEDDTVTVNVQEAADLDAAEPVSTSVGTPSKKRGRPKGSKTKRSPTPEGDLAPEEKYFWQNRPGPPQVSTNTFTGVKALRHEEYFEEMAKYRDHHEPDMQYLMRLHARSFPQWDFELGQGYNICLYGYGSKRSLIHNFAEWLTRSLQPAPRIIVVNGYTAKLSIRTVISTIASVISEKRPLRLVGQPQEMLDTLLSHLDALTCSGRLLVMINSLDGHSLRRSTNQAVLARLAAHPGIGVVASVDTTTSTLMWNSTLRDQFNFVFHDCTTFAPYDAEFSAVDVVNDLLGRKDRRIGGREGINYVLKSLPETARSLYRILLTELLTLMLDGMGDIDEEDYDPDAEDNSRKKRHGDDEFGVEYRTLYQKASEEFICSSDMNFRFLLKEFHDHQMITTTRDASGAELLTVPLDREELEAVLEDLVVG